MVWFNNHNMISQYVIIIIDTFSKINLNNNNLPISAVTITVGLTLITN